MPAYEEDLAYIHDAGFGGFAREAAPALLQLLRANGILDGLVVDLGCGSGIWAAALGAAGYEALGIDVSADMVALARERAPRARFMVGSYLDLDLPACRAVTAIGECFNYLFDGRAGRRQLQRLFERVHVALEPGGLFVFDVAEPGRGNAQPAAVRAWDEPDWSMILRVTEDASARRLRREITTFRKHGREFRRKRELHELRLYKGVELADDLRRAGFRARTVRRYGSLEFPRGLAGLIARKPE